MKENVSQILEGLKAANNKNENVNTKIDSDVLRAEHALSQTGDYMLKYSEAMKKSNDFKDIISMAEEIKPFVEGAVELLNALIKRK